MTSATENQTTELLRKMRKMRKMLDGCRRTETMGFDTYWITADALDSSLDELEQAIAAMFGSGTCRITASATDGLCSDNPRQYFELSCGHSFTLDGLGAPVACAVCGKAVER